MHAPDFVLWIHILCMVGAFGGIVAVQFGTPNSMRADPVAVRPALQALNMLLGLGLVAGLLLYGLKQGHKLGPHFNGVIAFKFIMLLGAGGLLAVSRKSPQGDTLRWIAAGLLALAALGAVSIS